uniref:FBD domain-containing protein n=1 Tax=Arundo donax TaxID=35708 RepID=A0A0A9B7E7_ARUDO
MCRFSEGPNNGYIVFRRDLRWCPTFSKLKALLMNDWCVAVDLSPLVCMLEHSPVLEKLTLQLRKGPKHSTENEGKYDPMNKSIAISEHLKKVVVKCEEVDERVYKIFKFLSTFDMEITVKIKEP